MAFEMSTLTRNMFFYNKHHSKIVRLLCVPTREPRTVNVNVNEELMRETPLPLRLRHIRQQVFGVFFE